MSDEIERMDAARNFPTNTCAASRHAALIAENLITDGISHDTRDDPKHAGESIAATVGALWKARTAVAGLRAENERLREALLGAARSAEALKRDCGMDPESPQAIRNAQYMAISYAARAALEHKHG